MFFLTPMRHRTNFRKQLRTGIMLRGDNYKHMYSLRLASEVKPSAADLSQLSNDVSPHGSEYIALSLQWTEP